MQKVGCSVLALVFCISRLLIGIIRHGGFVPIINAGFLSVPFSIGGIIGRFACLPILGVFGAASKLRFAPCAQVANSFGELFCIGSKLLDNRGLAGFDVGKLFLLIFSQADGVLARRLIALYRLLKLGLGLGLV